MKVELERAVAIQGMQENWILAFMPKHGNSVPDGRPPENAFFRKFLIFMERSLNFASNEPSTTKDIKFKSSYARKHEFSLLCPNMEIQPQAPKNGIFQKKIHFCEKVSRLRFQRALNHPQTLSLSQVMQENVIMPKYGNSAPSPKKINFFGNF